MHLSYAHVVTSENPFHCTRLYVCGSALPKFVPGVNEVSTVNGAEQNGVCAQCIMVSEIQWQLFWLAAQFCLQIN